jgi:DnaJ-class molecular chaperone
MDRSALLLGRTFGEPTAPRFVPRARSGLFYGTGRSLTNEIGVPMATELYDTLGVEKSATDKEIRTAYRKLAKEFHPDLNPGDAAAEERFKDIAAAFDILKDSENRAKYDRGDIDASGAEAQPEQRYYRQYADANDAHAYATSAGYDDFVNMSDLFGEAYARRGASRPGADFGSMPFPGADLRYHMTVEFLEAAQGVKKRVTMPDGKTLDISVPAGTRDGQVLRLKGKGEPGLNGGPNGDAYISIEVAPHTRFTRDGNDIVLDLPIGLHEAVLGGKIQVPTISGRVTMTVPKAAKTGQTLRLRGKGITTKNGSGDQLVKLNVVMPDRIDDELETFMTLWADKHGYDPRETWEAKNV